MCLKYVCPLTLFPVLREWKKRESKKREGRERRKIMTCAMEEKVAGRRRRRRKRVLLTKQFYCPRGEHSPTTQIFQT